MSKQTPAEFKVEKDSIVEHAVSQAYASLPVLQLSWWQRLVIILLGILVLGNSAFSAYNYSSLRAVQECTNTTNANARVVAAQDRAVVDELFQGLGDQIAAKKLTSQSIDTLIATYKKERAANDAERAKIYSKDCTKS